MQSVADPIFEIDEKDFEYISEYIKANYGIRLGQEKKSLLASRLRNIMTELNFEKFSDYIDYIKSDKTGTAINLFIDKITTNHTFFMREPAHFEYLKRKVLPELEKTVNDKDLRIWSAGCSSGEEPYTIAMILDEYFGSQSGWDKKILATDIAQKVLNKAMDGVYLKDQIGFLPPQWRMNYFTKNPGNDSYQVVDKIKNEVIFRRFNLMDKYFPFKKKFHVIFCRNVMIYFDSKTRNELVEKFYEFTEPGGYLFIGHSESLNRSQTKYKYIKPAIYRK